MVDRSIQRQINRPAYVRPKKRRWFLWAALVLVVLIVAAAATYLFLFFHTLNKTKNSFTNGEALSLSSLTKAQTVTLNGEASGRTNIVFYGLTADSERTDSILLVSYYWKQQKIVTLNVPRDLYADYDGYTGKIVSLYTVALNKNSKDKSYAPQFVTDFLSKEYNIPIQYWVVCDMNSLTQVVDTLGGITVNNPTAFTDYEFPTANYTGYIRPAPHFAAGVLNLNGTQALIYARSRHSLTPGEGTDFARSQRQESVLKAILDKLKSEGILNDSTQLLKFIQIFSNDIYTNLKPEDLISMANTVQRLDLSRDYLSTNWSFSSGFLCDATASDGEDIILYGIQGDCTAEAGVNSQSLYRKQAVYYVQNLLNEAEGQTSSPSPSP